MHMSWCNSNGIKIYPAPIDDYKLRLVVETNGVGEVGLHVYKSFRAKMTKSDIDWSDTIRRLYTELYLKLGGSAKEKPEIELEIVITDLELKY